MNLVKIEGFVYCVLCVNGSVAQEFLGHSRDSRVT